VTSANVSYRYAPEMVAIFAAGAERETLMRQSSPCYYELTVRILMRHGFHACTTVTLPARETTHGTPPGSKLAADMSATAG